ncbi:MULTISPECIES: Gfo/Idh/MocA family oxidoreductase [Fusobacterium]|uniref:Gfo/Idh/MocA family oxidoreductase n=1 Tax=Fusobacterium TaxID=848 RepID=UPI0008A2A45B|nr:Gfo/Idh/MocA family oxidoreductase [Fusobacterium varium]OFL79632.1 glycerol-3-phosphate cytidylyltransferase [Fusobacterium sp. HMSC073F01]
MKKVITYGTFDLLHQGHINLLKRAKEYGDYLIVGVTTDSYDKYRGKLNVNDSIVKRIENIKKSGYADEIIIEEYEGQKVEDIQKYNIDTFVIGSDWKGKFDYLKEFCEVVYLERTKGISSTQIREDKNKILKIGIIGAGRIAERFVIESKYVSGINIEGVMSKNIENSKKFAEKFELEFYTNNFEEFIEKVDAVYVATPHNIHYYYAKRSLENKKHVLCEKPITLSLKETNELYEIAKKYKLVLLEAIKTAFCPGFEKLISIAKSGIIGQIKDVEACFTKLVEGEIRELNCKEFGGSVTELASYPLLAIVKLLGKPKNVEFYSYIDKEKKIDLYTKILLKYQNGITPIAKVGLGVKSEGELIISGTKGYIYVPSPWWKTEYFELRFEDFAKNKKYFYSFQGEGLRYEIAEFLNMIILNKQETYKLKSSESKIINEIIEKFLEKDKKNG